MAEDDGSDGAAASSGHAPPGNALPGQSSTIQVFARIRPPRRGASSYLKNRYEIEHDASLSPLPQLILRPSWSQDALSRKLKDAQIERLSGNKEASYRFGFRGILEPDVTQDHVFDTVARGVVDSVLEGFNGAIFAYGQTGSGKTFTITGGAQRYADRGLIPRVLQHIFKHAANDISRHYEISVSYLEIYNECGYDLLDQSRDAKKLEDLPKVSLQEDADEVVHVRNLAAYPASNEEQALNLLFVGDTNRIIAETPSNPASSRSHCLFIINIESKGQTTDTIRRSRLHLVDLAGSERVSRTHIRGNLLKEAKYINLSLHYLEQVILALYEKSQGRRVHVPYRNSMMTSVLRDSLGGNCKTTMVATLAMEDELVDESISTCRFAQRVALINNVAIRNEELDPRLVIQRLKTHIAKLQSELALYKGEGKDAAVTPYEMDVLRRLIGEYVTSTDPSAEFIPSHIKLIPHSFPIFKAYATASGRPIAAAAAAAPSRAQITELVDHDAAAPPADAAANEPSPALPPADHVQCQKVIAHRDNEITILVSMIQKLKGQLARGEAPAAVSPSSSSSPERPSSSSSRSRPRPPAAAALPPPALVPVSPQRPPQAGPATRDPPAQGPSQRLADTTLTAHKAELFASFRSTYSGNAYMTQQKAVLKRKYDDAKRLGGEAMALKQQIKERRLALSDAVAASAAAGAAADPAAEPAREAEIAAIQALGGDYKRVYAALKNLKSEIEHLQHLLDQARMRLTRDFERWYEDVYLVECERQQHGNLPPAAMSSAPAAEAAAAAAAAAAAVSAPPAASLAASTPDLAQPRTLAQATAYDPAGRSWAASPVSHSLTALHAAPLPSLGPAIATAAPASPSPSLAPSWASGATTAYAASPRHRPSAYEPAGRPGSGSTPRSSAGASTYASSLPAAPSYPPFALAPPAPVSPHVAAAATPAAVEKDVNAFYSMRSLLMQSLNN